MEARREDAQESLERIEEVTDRTRKLMMQGGALLFLLWGVVWTVGFVVTQFAPQPQYCGSVWLIVVAVGVIATIQVSRRFPIKSPLGSRIGFLWWGAYAYAALWIALLWPFVHVSSQAEPQFVRHYGAIASTIPMFVYVVMGLWLGSRVLIGVALAITAFTVAGLFVLPQWYWLWMAVMGGGTLLGTGLVIRRKAR